MKGIKSIQRISKLSKILVIPESCCGFRIASWNSKQIETCDDNLTPEDQEVGRPDSSDDFDFLGHLDLWFHSTGKNPAK
jgi:hypothetical protein